MTLFGQRVRELRQRRGLSQRELGERVGCSGPAIHDWESGKTNPMRVQRNLLDKAASILETTPEFLLSGRTNPLKVAVPTYGVRAMVDESDFDPTIGVLIPVYDMDISAGPGSIIPEYIETDQKLHFTRSWLQKMGVSEDDIKIVKVRGDSMQPTLWDGDAVMLDRKKTRVRDDRVFALAYGGDARVKRLHLLPDGSLRVISDNPDKVRYPDEIIRGEDLNSVVIIGQVIHKMGSGGL